MNELISEPKTNKQIILKGIITAFKMIFYIILFYIGLIAVFFSGQIYEQHKKEEINIKGLCHYCTGERSPQSVLIQKDELRLTCSKNNGENKMVLLLNRAKVENTKLPTLEEIAQEIEE